MVFIAEIRRELRRVWRYQKGNQNPYIEEEQTTQWLREKVQKDKQRSTKHTHKTKDPFYRIEININSSNLFPKTIDYFLLCILYIVIL